MALRFFDQSEELAVAQAHNAHLLQREHVPQPRTRLCSCWKLWPCPVVQTVQKRLGDFRAVLALTQRTEMFPLIEGPVPSGFAARPVHRMTDGGASPMSTSTGF